MFFFFNDTATTEIYTLSLHDALPIYRGGRSGRQGNAKNFTRLVITTLTISPRPRCMKSGRKIAHTRGEYRRGPPARKRQDRKSTRLNSSHANISYAVFCLKKKNLQNK